MSTNPLFTIGHSNQSLDAFVELLRRHAIDAVADVRSWPVSRYTPHFDGERLALTLPRAGIRYVFLGKELGARRSEQETYVNGKVNYDLVARTSLFCEGLDRVIQGMRKFRMALMCAEKEPLECHRTILVCRHLRSVVSEINHILGDGTVENHVEAERRLLSVCGIPENDLFLSREELIDSAYRSQGERLAYTVRDETEEVTA